MIRKFRPISLLAPVLVACIATPAFAQAKTAPPPEEGVPTKWATGIRGGAGLGQTDGVVGYVWQSPAMGPSDYLRFRPAVTGAFAGGFFAAGLNLDLVTSLKIPSSNWSLLFGGGISLFLNHTSGGGCVVIPNQNQCIGGGGGGNAFAGSHELVVGFQKPSGLFIEVRAVSALHHGTEMLVGYFFKKGNR